MLQSIAESIIKYIVGGEDFITIADGIFADFVRAYSVQKIELFQISKNEDCLNRIAGRSGFCEKLPDAVLDLSQAPFLKNAKEIVKNNNELYFPVFIRDRVAMYVRTVLVADASYADIENVLSQVAVILQNIAVKKNFEDSLQNSYKLLGDILDQIPSGVIVLDNANRDVLMMNKTAAQSEAVQLAIGIGLNLYISNGNSIQESVYEKESGNWYDVTFSELGWMNGETVLMVTTVDVTQKVKNQQRIEYQANNDYLTGLFNRMKCESDLKEILKDSVAKNERGIVIYLDLDDFKQVNDGLGHQYGDVLLQEIANGITSIEEISNSCYRMGGDEFVIVVKPFHFSSVTHIVEAICKMFATPWNLMGVEYVCTMSMGLAIFPEDATHVHDLLQKADFAMYEAKKGGKNRYLWYSETDSGKDECKSRLEQSIKKAVENNFQNMKVEYSVYNTPDGEGMIYSPEIFMESSVPEKQECCDIFAMAEYMGVMTEIGKHILLEGLRKAKTHNEYFVKVMIPVSSVQILAPHSVDTIVNACEEMGVEKTKIILAISETTEFRDRNKALAVMEILRAHGFSIAVTDFGKGSMSLDKIKKYGADYVRYNYAAMVERYDCEFAKAVVSSLDAYTNWAGIVMLAE